MLRRSYKLITHTSAALLILVGLWSILLAIWLPLANSDVTARSRQAVWAAGTVGKQGVTLALVLHRIAPEQNGVEASLQLWIDDPEVTHGIAQGETVRATLTESSGTLPLPLVVSLNSDDAQRVKRGYLAETARFILPTFSLLADYPFDAHAAKVDLRVSTSGGMLQPARYLVQKDFPGRELSLASDRPQDLYVLLERPLVERVLILTSALVFLLLLGVAVFQLNAPGKEARAISSVASVAATVISIAGIRDIVGLDDLPSTSWLELLVVGGPLLILAAAFLRLLGERPEGSEAEQRRRVVPPHG